MIKGAGGRLVFTAAFVLFGAASIMLAATGGNSYYQVAVEQTPAGVGLGVYTFATGVMHPVRASFGPQDVLVGHGMPGTSFTAIRSYTSGTDYVQRTGLTLSSGAPPTLELEDFVAAGEEAIPVGDPQNPTGFMTIYRPGGFAPAPDDLVIRQTAAAIGTTFDNSAVMLKTEITNNGAAAVSVGVRYLWDMMIGANDDGPSFRAKGPDGQALSTATSFSSPAFSRFEITDDNDPDPCFGMGNSPFPFYAVGGSVTGPATLTPTAPTRLAYVSWPDASGLPDKFGSVTPAVNAFDYQALGMDVSTCLYSNDDTGVAYWWGNSAANKLTIAPGATVSVAAFVFAYLPGMPPTFPPPPVEGPPGDPSCSDGTDNDGDGLVDGNDPDCVPPPAPVEGPAGDPSCSDGVDNDSDGLVDMSDPDCVPPPSPVEGPAGDPSCSDSIDNDGDGLVDMNDPDCVPSPSPVEGPVGDPSCSDGIDNDGDGLVDGADPGCVPPPIPVEGPIDDPSCSDGIDNDGDGLVDADDPECGSATSPIEGPPESLSCSDDVDNDEDGLVDGDDPDCLVPNTPPSCGAARPSDDSLWPPNHKLETVRIRGVSDADGDPVAITVISIKQDEPLSTVGEGNTCPDANGVGGDSASVRAERSATADGRVYHIAFTADDGAGGRCTGEVTVCVPRTRGRDAACIDQGSLFDSLRPCAENTRGGHGRP